VKALQRHLHVTPTGYFGRVTLRKVKAVQAAADLTADGVVGVNTAAAMGFTYAAR
jgi:peptidoglycan hydrolase-like protein with peptidoglycan-binding domain